MFRPIRTLTPLSYFVAEHGVKGQLIEANDGFSKVEYLDHDGKKKRSEWSSGTPVIRLTTSPFDTTATTTAIDTTPADTNTAPKRPRRFVFGKPLTSVVRWMGKQGWDVDRAVKALARVGIDEPSLASIKTCLWAGAGGHTEYGPVAELTDAEVRELSGKKQKEGRE